MVRSRASAWSMRLFLMSAGMRSVRVVVPVARLGGRPGRAFMLVSLSVVGLTFCSISASVSLTGWFLASEALSAGEAEFCPWVVAALV